MATLTGNTLTIAYQGEGNLYVVVVRLIADGRVFDGSNLVPFSTDALVQYAVALTSRGGDLYSVSVPPALPTGTFQFLIYERAGNVPAPDDLILASPVYAWDGVTGSEPDPGETPTPSVDA